LRADSASSMPVQGGNFFGFRGFFQIYNLFIGEFNEVITNLKKTLEIQKNFLSRRGSNLGHLLAIDTRLSVAFGWRRFDSPQGSGFFSVLEGFFEFLIPSTEFYDFLIHFHIFSLNFSIIQNIFFVKLSNSIFFIIKLDNSNSWYFKTLDKSKLKASPFNFDLSRVDCT